MSALACARCGAGLPPPDPSGSSVCVYCGAEHLDRGSSRWAAALAPRPSQIDLSGSVEDAARIPLTEEHVLPLLREHFGVVDAVFVCPHVPPEKEIAARRAHAEHLPERERVLALYDASWFGRGAEHEGFVVTVNRFCWKNPRQAANTIEWRDLDPEEIYPESERLVLGADVVELSEDALRNACALAFHVLALSGLPVQPTASGCVVAAGKTSARVEAPRPPANALTSYANYASHAEARAPDRSCWHCRTPLWAETPQCSFCGAFPKTTGWLRTG
jgi:hypothetical protein